MVQRVPAHLDEATGSPPWLVITGVVLVILVACVLIFFALGGPSRLTAFGMGSSPTPTRTRTPATAPVTIIPVILNTSTPTPGPTAVTIKYKVKAGDSLSTIAERYHVPVRIIMAVNGLKDETIRIGDDLLIPLPTPTPPPNPTSVGTPTPLSLNSPPSSVEATAKSGVTRHIVQRGDTLIGIAAQYGSTVTAIRAANQLASDALSIGQTLLVPGISWTPTPFPTTIPDAPPTTTPEFAYAAPSLNSPPDNSQFRGSGNAPTLTWLSPAILKPGEYYVVNIQSRTAASQKAYPSISVRQGTSVKLEALYYSDTNTKDTLYSWYVVIVSQTVGAQVIAHSPPSATRSFVWY
jgi:LysM repeat protein